MASFGPIASTPIASALLETGLGLFPAAAAVTVTAPTPVFSSAGVVAIAVAAAAVTVTAPTATLAFAQFPAPTAAAVAVTGVSPTLAPGALALSPAAAGVGVSVPTPSLGATGAGAITPAAASVAVQAITPTLAGGEDTLSAPEEFQYWELWDKLEAAGGQRLAFLWHGVGTKRVRRTTGDDRVVTGFAKAHRAALLFEEGKVLVGVWSRDGQLKTEHPIERVARGDGPLIGLECVSVRQKLVNYPITLTDADGFVYQDNPAIQLPATTILGPSFIRSNTPAYFGTGLVTPSEVFEVPFSGDSAATGLTRLEEVTGYEAAVRRNGPAQYLLHLVRLGAGAPKLYLREGKNLKSLQEDGVPHRQITRITTFKGADGDEGPSGIAWAYWEVEATSGAGPYLVKLKASHGGPGPIKFDDQLNHANLPDGANSLYLEKADRSKVQITGSLAATQEIQVASLTGISVGDRVRIVASAAGKQLTFLDAPAELVGRDPRAGEFTSAFDDTFTILPNGLQHFWLGTLPVDWEGAGAKTTATNESLTCGQAILINQYFADGQLISRPRPTAWKVQNRRHTFSAVAWVRLLTATAGGEVAFRITANGQLVGSELSYLSPVNTFVQLKIEGLDLSAFIGQTPTLSAEIVKSKGAGHVHMIVDSINLTPSLSARGITEDANATRIWQQANEFLDQRRVRQVTYRRGVVDLAALGRTNQAPVTLGGEVESSGSEYPTVTGRILEIADTPEEPAEVEVIIGTLPPSRVRDQAKPLALVIPYLDPIHVRVADRDTRLAALKIKATTTASDAESVTVMVEAIDSLGGGPEILAEAFGATYVSGAGAGPWKFLKPGAGMGQGRVVFTARLAGRDDVTDALDVAESTFISETGLLFAECRITVVAITATTYVLRVTGLATTGIPTVQLVSVTGSAALASGAAVGTPVVSGAEWTFTRGAPASGLGEVQFRAVLDGAVTDDDLLKIAEQGASTTALSVRPHILAVTAEAMTVRVSVVDPIPQGAGSATINRTGSGVGTITPASGQTVTPESTYTEGPGTYVDYTIPRPVFGAGDGSVLFEATASGRVSDSDLVTVPAQAPVFVDIVYSECYAVITTLTATQATVTVTGVRTPGTVSGQPFVGEPTVELVVIVGTASLDTGPAIGVPSPSGQTWVFNRGAVSDPFSVIQFRAVQEGTQADDDFVAVPAQSDSTLRLLSRARVIAAAPTTVTVRVAVADPTPQGADSGTITYVNPDNLAIDLASGLTVTPEATLTENEGTFRDYIISRPSSGQPTGRVIFTASAASRTDDEDPVDIPPRQAVIYNQCIATVTSITATQYIITVTGIATAGVPTVQLVGIMGVATLAGGPAPGMPSPSGTRWLFNRAPVGGGTSRVQFRAVFPGTQSDDAFVPIAEVGAATTAVELRARVLNASATQVVIRAALADPTPQGPNSGTIAYVASGTGAVSPVSPQLVTPEATLTEAAGTYIDVTVNRPANGAGDGSILFTGSAASRLDGSDAVTIPEQSLTSGSPYVIRRKGSTTFGAGVNSGYATLNTTDGTPTGTWTVSSTTITIPADGQYVVAGGSDDGSVTSSPEQLGVIIELVSSGLALAKGTGTGRFSTGGSSDFWANAAGIAELQAGDEIRLFVRFHPTNGGGDTILPFFLSIAKLD